MFRFVFPLKSFVAVFCTILVGGILLDGNAKGSGVGVTVVISADKSIQYSGFCGLGAARRCMTCPVRVIGAYILLTGRWVVSLKLWRVKGGWCWSLSAGRVIVRELLLEARGAGPGLLWTEFFCRCKP